MIVQPQILQAHLLPRRSREDRCSPRRGSREGTVPVPCYRARTPSSRHTGCFGMPLGFDDSPLDGLASEASNAPQLSLMVVPSSVDGARVTWVPSVKGGHRRRRKDLCRQLVAVAGLITTLFLAISMWRSLLLPLFDQHAAGMQAMLLRGGKDVNLQQLGASLESATEAVLAKVPRA